MVRRNIAALLRVSVIILGASFSRPAMAEYLVTGQIRGNECSSYIFFSVCNFVTIDAAGDEKGKLYTLTQRYDEVSRFDSKKKKCWINVKTRGAGHISNVINMFFLVTFYTKKDEEYIEVDPEYLVFPCVKK